MFYLAFKTISSNDVDYFLCTLFVTQVTKIPNFIHIPSKDTSAMQIVG